MSAWLLPDYIADVLPIEARRIEELRRNLLDLARCYGYELVMPPLLEHQESLLTGAGQSMDLNTFKLVDQLSGRMLALRADMTSQVARLDAHMLNRQGVTRLCYCGPVVHTRPHKPHATREPLQLGAEIYGHAGLEADLEVQELALQSLQAAGVQQPISIDLADIRIVQGILAPVSLTPAMHDRLHTALSAKDAPALHRLSQDFPVSVRQDLAALIQLYGDAQVLDEAERRLSSTPLVQQALADLRWMAQHLPRQTLTFDLADLRGYDYYSGMCFAIYVQGASDAVVRGGRYDEVGAVFGRNRPAVGFSLDLKELAAVAPAATARTAIRAPWGQAPALRAAIEQLRAQGHTVVCVLPGHENESCEFHCDRELKNTAGQWVVTPC